MAIMDNRVYLLSLLAGILSEALLFSRGEWDRHAPTVTKVFTLVAIGALFLFWMVFGLPYAASVRETVLHSTSLLTGLFGSMATYRLFYHPLKAFPGPFGARLSSLWVIKKSIPDLMFYVKLRDLHDQYGDFVRIRKLPAVPDTATR